MGAGRCASDSQNFVLWKNTSMKSTLMIQSVPIHSKPIKSIHIQSIPIEHPWRPPFFARVLSLIHSLSWQVTRRARHIHQALLFEAKNPSPVVNLANTSVLDWLNT